jgi:hypothetical protein
MGLVISPNMVLKLEAGPLAAVTGAAVVVVTGAVVVTTGAVVAVTGAVVAVTGAVVDGDRGRSGGRPGP